MRTLVIGDIHGCYRELQLLLDKAGLSTRDRIIAVGDLVDRGPASLQVADFFRARRGALAVLGNHEREHILWARGDARPNTAMKLLRAQARARYTELLTQFSAMPLYVEMPDAVVVHGCLEPGVRLQRQDPAVLTGSQRGERYLLRTYRQPWYELYRGRRPVIVGHRDYRRDGAPFVHRDRVYCIDTGCCRGGTLTGIVLPEFRIVSVPARRNYWAAVRDRYADKPR